MPDTTPNSEFKATCLRVIDQIKNTGAPVIVTLKKESWAGKYEKEIKVKGDIIKPATDETEWDVLD